MISSESFFQSDPWIRIPIYAVLGCVCEIFFTALSDLFYPEFLSSWNVHSNQLSISKPDWRVKGRDPRLVGYTFLWMLPIYAGMIFLEPIHNAIRNYSFFYRGIIYLLLVWFAEFVSGWLIKKITGRCPWDYSYSFLSYYGYIRWDYAPVWFLFGFVFEYFHDRLVFLTPAIRAAFLG